MEEGPNLRAFQKICESLFGYEKVFEIYAELFSQHIHFYDLFEDLTFA